jgi:aminocarboxymuconate-semialdehyde decarboxylase
MKIDVHNHVLPREVLELFKTDPAFGTSLKEKQIDIRGFAFSLSQAFYDPQAKLHELEQHELDAAVVSMAPPSFLYELAADKTQILCAAANDGLARFAKHAPDRFRWMAHVPMLSPDHAMPMLKQAKADGAVGVEIATSIAGRRLDDSMFDGFWATAEALNLLVMIHPWYNSAYPGLDDWYFQNVIGNPLETMIAGCRLICSGLLDRRPALRILLVHGGGNLPYQLGRLQHAISVRPELKNVSKDPWAFAGRLVFDSLTHDEKALVYLVDRVGIDNVVFGTDLPFDMAPTKPVSQVRAALGEGRAAQVLERNPATLLGFA